MEIGLIKFYKEKVKNEWKITFISTFILGILIHSYRFMHLFVNHDAIFNYHSSQNMVSSGRWLLSFVCGFSSYFNLPWVIGIISIFFIALTAVIVVDIFKVKSSILCIIIGGILVSFPSVTSTFAYEFTADGYMIAMFLAAVSVRLCLMDEKKLYKFFLSAILLCCVCAIYQAYVSFAMVLLLSYFILEMLDAKHKNKDCFIWITKIIGTYVVAMGLYYVIWKLCIYFGNVEVTSYRGINQIGNIDIYYLKDAFFEMTKHLYSFFLDIDIEIGYTEWNHERGFTPWNTINIVFIISAIITILVSIKKSKIYKRKMQFVLFILAGCAIPFSAYICFFVARGMQYSTRMEQSLCLIYILIALMFYKVISKKWSCIISIILAMFIFYNGVNANTFYYYMERCNKQTYATAIEISTRIHELDDGTIKEVAFGGALVLASKEDLSDKSKLGTLGKIKPIINLFISNKHVCLYLYNELNFELSYYKANKDVKISSIKKSGNDPVPNDWTFEFPTVTTDEELEEIKNTEEYKNAPCWPAKDSVYINGDTVIVKLSD